MCGIAGVRRFGDTPITREELQILVCSLEHRGNHATGIAIANDSGNTIAIHKMPEPAWSFVKHNATTGFLDEHLTNDTSIVLLHTRFATCGSPMDNANNHPMFDGVTAVVHNGGIRNHEALFKSENLTPACATDSDYIRAVFDTEGFEPKAVRLLSKAWGSGAIAAISTAYPGVLALGRSGNPLVYAEAHDKLYFASEMKAIHKAVRPWIQKRGLWMRRRSTEIAYNAMQDNTMYFINGDGEESSHHELRIAAGFTPPQYRSYENYAEKMKTWKVNGKSERVFTKCRKCGLVQSKVASTEWKNLKCGNTKCQESFGYLQNDRPN
jgi:glucosamine 6-phosphate synthetase-like amidotransferase/phosphosugar isomerase protein